MTATDIAQHEGLKVFEERRTVNFIGTQAALIKAGLLKLEWIEGLGSLQREIVLDAHGNFTVVGEGKGCRICLAHRQHGAYTIKRAANGCFRVCKFRTPIEQDAYHERWAQECRARMEQHARVRMEQLAWSVASVATKESYEERWKVQILHAIGELEELLSGSRIYRGFPEVTLQGSDLNTARETCAMLRQTVNASKPRLRLTEKAEHNNVIQLRSRSFRSMRPR